MTSVEVPYSIASALPSLTVLDITNEVRRELAGSGRENGLAFVSPLDGVALVRVQERESGFFCDLEDLLNRLVPQEQQDRERLLCMLLGPREDRGRLIENSSTHTIHASIQPYTPAARWGGGIKLAASCRVQWKGTIQHDLPIFATNPLLQHRGAGSRPL